MTFVRLTRCAGLAALGLAASVLGTMAHATTPAELLAGYSALAGTPAAPGLGRQLFVTRQRDWNCASCHSAEPSQPGTHASTGKPIGPLAPAFNPERFTDAAKVEKWFRRNCNDVMNRDCTAAEKADILSWLMTIKP
jgi:hypothetical protein